MSPAKGQPSQRPTPAQRLDPQRLDPQRLDQWLWYARFVKTRTLATRLCASGRVRVNGERIDKPARTIKPDDVLTFPLGPHIRTIKILRPATRRGPAPEAQSLYEDLSPPVARAEKKQPEAALPAYRETGSGRPTKKQRRQTDALKTSQ